MAVDGERQMVFVCDRGVKAFDVTDPADIRGLYTTAGTSGVGKIKAYDCIAMDGVLLVTGEDGLYQLRYDLDGFSLISKIDLRP